MSILVQTLPARGAARRIEAARRRATDARHREPQPRRRVGSRPHPPGNRGPRMNARDELREAARGEISHHISPVIGWLRMDAVKGRDDSDRQRLTAFEERLGKAADAIVELVESRKPRTITTVEELDALPEGTIIACVKANPYYPSVFLRAGSKRAPWLHLDPSDREDGESTMPSGEVLRWHGNGTATVLHEPEAAK